MDPWLSESSTVNDEQYSDTVLKFLNQILVEDDDQPNMFHDPIALTTAEKSLYEQLIGHKYPSSPSSSSSSFARNRNTPFHESISQFKRGMEEASKFLPTTTTQLTIDPKGLKGKKNQHQYPDDGPSQRSNKQLATSYVEDFELSEMLDRVLLRNDTNTKPPLSNIKTSSRTKKSDYYTVDLINLLTSCAQFVAAGDHKVAYKQLNRIMQHSSPTGDVYQRLAYLFAKALHARLRGTGNHLYASLTRRKITSAELLKAYQLDLTAYPFKMLSIAFANEMISSVASQAAVLHIIDFGIIHGFQWPILIQHLSKRVVNGPLKLLRITGIDVPQPGLKPAERVKDTGSRLAKYCDRFGVPFEYQAIATQNWERIDIKEFKIKSGEVVVVNSLFRFGRLLDETVMVESPRDGVLTLIRKLKPDMLVSAVKNGSFGAPFFATRFREALFYYSALFDMFDATVVSEYPERVEFEQDFYGREVINVVACEGVERVERPETYKQWQVRHLRAGFKPIPLDEGIVRKIREKKKGYDKDFVLDQDGCWMLQGWKGRVICASSCWIPAA